MNGRVVLLVVLNALVAVALAVLITVLVTRGDAPAVPGQPAAPAAAAPAGAPGSAEPPTVGEGAIETPRGPQVRRSYPAEEPRELAARLKGDLMDREELIPFEGQLGGTMGFYDPDSIYILSDRWVYAEFTDGHVQGGMLLEYTFESDDEASWRVLEARLE